MGERVLSLHRREGLFRGEVVPAAAIYIDGDLPAECSPDVYEADATALVDLLWNTLPGGTVDQVLAQLMARRVSLLRVGFLSVDELVGLNDAREHKSRWAVKQRVELAESICAQEPEMRSRGGTVLAVTVGALDMCQVLFDGETKSRIVPETYLMERQEMDGRGPDLVG